MRLQTKTIIYWLPLALSVAAFPFAIAGFYMAVTQNDAVVYEQGALDSDEAADVAARSLAESQRLNDTADTVLGLLEGGSVLITIIVGSVAVVFTLNLRDLREDLEAEVRANQEKVDNILQQRQNELTQLSTRIRDQAEASRGEIERLTSLINDRLRTARDEAEVSFRVLNLQVLAEQQVRARNYDTAIIMLQEAHRLNPDHQPTNYLLGYLYISRRQFEESLTYLRKALESDQNFAPALAATGLALRRLGDQYADDPETRNRYWAEAEFNLGHALEMEPGMLDADGESYYGTLGGLYRRQERYEDARRAYQRAVEFTPQSSYPVGNLAVLTTAMGRMEEAVDYFARVQRLVEAKIEDNPGDYWARLDLAQALLMQGKVQAAVRQYEEIINRETPISAIRSALDTLETLAKAPQKAADMEQVLELLRDVIASEQPAD
jgi:tetratricopeptide (TPR) repeat protein